MEELLSTQTFEFRSFKTLEKCKQDIQKSNQQLDNRFDFIRKCDKADLAQSLIQRRLGPTLLETTAPKQQSQVLSQTLKMVRQQSQQLCNSQKFVKQLPDNLLELRKEIVLSKVKFESCIDKIVSGVTSLSQFQYKYSLHAQQLISENAAIYQRLKEYDKERVEMKLQIQQLQIEDKSKIEQINHQMSRNEELQQQIRELNEKIQEQIKETENAKLEMKQNQLKSDLLLSNQKTDLEQKMSKIQQKNAQLAIEVKGLQTQLSSTQQSAQSSTTSKEELQAEIQVLKQSHLETEHENIIALNQIMAERAQTETLYQEQLNHLKNEILKSTLSSVEVNEQTEEIQNVIRAQQTKILQFLGEFNGVLDKFGDVGSKINVLENEIKVQQNDRNYLEIENQGLELMRQAANNEVHALFEIVEKIQM
ncbi:Hypothetical_protein [Hexamita inflata]|uniref:Hypothetical_protein n=1 Tax=Hexamita inflata TaxID=28002 RepID=A0AA86TLN2_9EUKA|nr:Hypothetical protein HINF_LOCUS4233 [Hexamita inflata]